MRPPLDTPALTLWRRRADLAARDPLWAAACEERTALELAAAGCHDGARQALERAQAIVAAAVHCAATGCEHQGTECWRRAGARRRRNPGNAA